MQADCAIAAGGDALSQGRTAATERCKLSTAFFRAAHRHPLGRASLRSSALAKRVITRLSRRPTTRSTSLQSIFSIKTSKFASLTSSHEENLSLNASMHRGRKMSAVDRIVPTSTCPYFEVGFAQFKTSEEPVFSLTVKASQAFHFQRCEG